MDPAPADVRDLDLTAWAGRLRQATQQCAAHQQGPVVTFARLVTELNAEQRAEVGRRVIAESHARLAELTMTPGGHLREESVITVVRALCGL